MASKDVLGARGEQLAAAHLEAAGYDILDRNWRCRHGELDIVAAQAGELVFVEVKTRSGTGYGHPLEAITAVKLGRLRQLAAAWCEVHDTRGRMRLDAIGVIAPPIGAVTLQHVRGIG